NFLVDNTGHERFLPTRSPPSAIVVHQIDQTTPRVPGEGIERELPRTPPGVRNARVWVRQSPHRAPEPGRFSPKTGRQGRQELSTPLERASCPHPGPASPSPLEAGPGPLRAARSAALHQGLDQRAELVVEDVKGLPATFLIAL